MEKSGLASGCEQLRFLVWVLVDSVVIYYSISGERREQSQFCKGWGKGVVVNNNGVTLYWTSSCPALYIQEHVILDCGPELPGHFC